MEEWLASKRTFGYLLEIIGVGLIVYAFKLQADNNAHNAAGAFLGLAPEGTTAPYLVGAAGLAAIVLGWFMIRRPDSQSRLAAGWHDDPDSPHRLRYHDGQQWTEKTAEKS